MQNRVPAIKVMKIGGWEDIKTMESFVRLAEALDNFTLAI
jgi:hypothetical protein